MPETLMATEEADAERWVWDLRQETIAVRRLAPIHATCEEQRARLAERRERLNGIRGWRT